MYMLNLLESTGKILHNYLYIFPVHFYMNDIANDHHDLIMVSWMYYHKSTKIQHEQYISSARPGVLLFPMIWGHNYRVIEQMGWSLSTIKTISVAYVACDISVMKLSIPQTL